MCRTGTLHHAPVRFRPHAQLDPETRAVRQYVWAHAYLYMPPANADLVEIPRALLER
jgi:hypothetical protein